MSLNCRPGDLAVVVRSMDGNFGKLVHVLRAYEKERGWWVCEPLSELRTADAGWTREKVCAADESLRPITPPAGTITQSEVSELYAPRAPERVKANSAEFVSSKERER
jgi:hypothetical protein